MVCVLVIKLRYIYILYDDNIIRIVTVFIFDEGIITIVAIIFFLIIYD